MDDRPVPPCFLISDPALHQILLRDRGTELIVVLDEVVDELVQSGLENLFDTAVLQAGAHGARLTLGVALAAIGIGDAIEILHEILVTARQRARHLVLEHEQVGDEPRLDVLAIDPVIGGQRRHRTQDRGPLKIVERAADLFDAPAAAGDI